MHTRAVIIVTFAVTCSMGVMPAQAATPTMAPSAQTAPSTPVARRIGAIKTISGASLTLAPESGPEIAVTVAPSARILRLAPGDKDLKNAASIALQDLQVGDTIRVRGYASDDGKTFSALEVLVISRTAMDAVREQIREDWQKRGTGGLVSAVDPATGNVTISVSGGKKSIVVHASKNTIFRRYASDSIKIEDARPSSLGEIHAGDQLSCRGERSKDGTEVAAEEIVTGSFGNVAGIVNSIDASAGTLTVQDLISKKTVQVKVAADSQLHELPAELAQRIAMRLKASLAGNPPVGVPGASATPKASEGHVENGGAAGNSSPASMRPGGIPDFQQMLNRMPTVTLGDLKKGAAVMIVTKGGPASNGSTVITLLSGVEPILQAAPSASQAMMLSPWSLGGAPGGDAGQ